MRERKLNWNPAEAVTLPKQKKREINPMTASETELFFQAAKKSKHYPAFLLALSTGMRRGEILGLTWSCIDFENKIVKVQQQYAREENGHEMRTPKTDEGIRDIPLIPIVISALEEHKEKQYQEKEKIIDYQDNNLVFAAPKGTPYDPTAFSRRFTHYTKKAGLEGFRFHDLRHYVEC